MPVAVAPAARQSDARDRHGRAVPRVVHRLPGRIRFALDGDRPQRVAEALLVRELLEVCPRFELTYNRHTGRYLLTFDPSGHDPRGVHVDRAIGRALLAPDLSTEECDRLLAAAREAARPAGFQGALHSAARVIVPQVARFLLIRWLMPRCLVPLATAWRVFPYLREGLRDLAAGRQSIELLDAAAIAVSLARRNLDTANTIAFMLGLGSTLEQWTRDQARMNISALFRGDERPAWVRRDGVEVEVPVSDLVPGDLVVVRMGSRIPVDGVVHAGEATVNQAVMTGEGLPVGKRPGLTVYAGTVVEEGDLVMRAERVGEETRFARIARIIEAAESTQAEVVSESERLASRTVPFVFLASGLVWLLTGSWVRAASVLVVDFSCALKLATPLALKSAMLESAMHGVLVKGGKHLETLARADVLVFDKTGTLTKAMPQVAAVHPLGAFTRAFVLRNAACLEEHFAHPVATAIVRQAQREGLKHEERHAQVEYVVAHGIVSRLDGERVVVGGRHFVADHEGVDVSGAADIVGGAAAEGLSAVYFAVGGKLAGVIMVEDALVPEAPAVIARLREILEGRLALMTGDGHGAAHRVGAQVGISDVHAEVLPDDKTALVRRMQARGDVVAMVGDGVNDSAALAAADVGISLKHGADIAREAADILLLDGRLDSLVDAVAISRLALRRVKRTFAFSVGSNSLLMGLGVLGMAPAGLLAVMHNASTVASCLWSLRPLLPQGGGPFPR